MRMICEYEEEEERREKREERKKKKKRGKNKKEEICDYLFINRPGLVINVTLPHASCATWA